MKPSKASAPPVVGMLVVRMLSLSATGMPCSGPRIVPGGALAIERVGLFERVGIHGDRGVQLVLVEGDAREILRHQFARGDALLLQGGAHLGDAGFHHGEWFGLRVRGAGKKQQKRSFHPNQQFVA